MCLCLRSLHFCISAKNVLEGCCWQRLPGKRSGIWEDCAYLYLYFVVVVALFCLCVLMCTPVGQEQGAMQWQVVEVGGQLVGLVLSFHYRSKGLTSGHPAGLAAKHLSGLNYLPSPAI